MTIANELRKNLTNPNPLYVAAGTADLAVQKLRELPDTVDRLRAEAPERLPRLREQATSLALQGVGIALEYAVKARETYDGLAERGRTVVESRLGGVAGEPAAKVTVERVEAEDDPITEPAGASEPEGAGEAKESGGAASKAKDTPRRSAPRRKTGTGGGAGSTGSAGSAGKKADKG